MAPARSLVGVRYAPDGNGHIECPVVEAGDGNHLQIRQALDQGAGEGYAFAYRDDQGKPFVLDCVLEAEKRILQKHFDKGIFYDIRQLSRRIRPYYWIPRIWQASL